MNLRDAGARLHPLMRDSPEKYISDRKKSGALRLASSGLARTDFVHSRQKFRDKFSPGITHERMNPVVGASPAPSNVYFTP